MYKGIIIAFSSKNATISQILMENSFKEASDSQSKNLSGFHQYVRPNILAQYTTQIIAWNKKSQLIIMVPQSW
jgi:hypothetical protein